MYIHVCKEGWHSYKIKVFEEQYREKGTGKCQNHQRLKEIYACAMLDFGPDVGKLINVMTGLRLLQARAGEKCKKRAAEQNKGTIEDSGGSKELARKRVGKCMYKKKSLKTAVSEGTCT